MPKQPPRNFTPDPFPYHHELDLRIEDLTNLGQGVGRVEDWVVFVPYALPGERVRARVWRNKAKYSEADLVGILEPSPERVDPACPLFGDCGGCQYQHLAYASQLRWKTEQVRQLLRKMTGREMEVRPCCGNAERLYGYRSKLTPHFRRPPHLPGTAIGFQRASSRAIVDVPQCPIASPAINEALPLERARLQQEVGRFRKGGTLLLRDSDDGVVTDMKAVARETVLGKTFHFIAGEFFQNNPHMLPALVEHALAEAAAPGMRFLVDAYCGVGVFGICGSGRFERTTGIEVSERAIELARGNADSNSIPDITFQKGSAEAVFEGLCHPPAETCVIVDPPRRGCGQDFLVQLTAFAPARIVYVSCGPDTQARDANLLLEAGYTVDCIQPFDLFPHTRHIENVMTFVRPS
ncbi:MAG: TRAM domain-containing protein [Verrucomicrobia bacterium]|nr:TRAM domain-containing protein [Verrucomicrobiota bacterium]